MGIERRVDFHCSKFGTFRFIGRGSGYIQYFKKHQKTRGNTSINETLFRVSGLLSAWIEQAIFPLLSFYEEEGKMLSALIKKVDTTHIRETDSPCGGGWSRSPQYDLRPTAYDPYIAVQ